MKKGYSVYTNFNKGYNYDKIIVSNYEEENIINNWYMRHFDNVTICKNDVGVWKIKKLN